MTSVPGEDEKAECAPSQGLKNEYKGRTNGHIKSGERLTPSTEKTGLSRNTPTKRKQEMRRFDWEGMARSHDLVSQLKWKAAHHRFNWGLRRN